MYFIVITNSSEREDGGEFLISWTIFKTDQVAEQIHIYM